MKTKELVASGPISRILCSAWLETSDPKAAAPAIMRSAIIPLGRRSLGGSSGLPEGPNGPG
jgi:hypothetical protein